MQNPTAKLALEELLESATAHRHKARRGAAVWAGSENRSIPYCLSAVPRCAVRCTAHTSPTALCYIYQPVLVLMQMEVYLL